VNVADGADLTVSGEVVLLHYSRVRGALRLSECKRKNADNGRECG